MIKDQRFKRKRHTGKRDLRIKKLQDPRGCRGKRKNGEIDHKSPSAAVLSFPYAAHRMNGSSKNVNIGKKVLDQKQWIAMIYAFQINIKKHSVEMIDEQQNQHDPDQHTGKVNIFFELDKG